MTEMFDKSLAVSNKFQKDISDSKKYHWANNFNQGVGFFNKSTKTASQDSMKIFMDKAITAFKNAIILEPDSIATYKNLTFAYMNIGMQDSAIAPLQQLLAIEAKDSTRSPESYSMLGDIYTSKGKKLMDNYKTSNNAEDSVKAMEYYDKGLEVLKQGRQAFPNNSDLLSAISNAYIETNRLDEAKDIFKAGIESEPNNKYYHYNYGVLLLNAKDFDNAAIQFKKAVDLDGTYTNAIYNLAVTYVRWGAAIREKAEAEEKPSDEYKDKFKLALPYLEKYLEVKPEEAAIWELLGRVYANLGMEDKSKDAFNKADQLKK